MAAEYCGEVGCGAGAECATGAKAGEQSMWREMESRDAEARRNRKHGQAAARF